MSWGLVAVAGATLVGGAIASDAQRSAANKAADAQSAAAQAGISEQRQQFDAIQKLLNPYVQAGNRSLVAQQDIAGLNGNAAQQQAITALQQSPQFRSMLQQGQTSILQNASATGGLRGGNVQAALAQFSPALLAQTINDQYARLGGITSLGQNAAAGVGNAGMQTGGNISQLLGQQGSAIAGGALGQGAAGATLGNSISSAAGMYGLFSNFGNRPGATNGTYDPALNKSIGMGMSPYDYSIGVGSGSLTPQAQGGPYSLGNARFGETAPAQSNPYALGSGRF